MTDRYRSPSRGWKEVLTRLLFAVSALIAGDAGLLCVLSAHAGQLFPLYAAFSVVGWVMTALPVVYFVGRETLASLSWLIVVAVGAILGLAAWFGILLLLFVLQGRPLEFSLYGTGITWLFAIITSTTSFVVYVALLRWRRDVSR